MALGDLVTILNRTTCHLDVMRNGHIKTFPPGETKDVPWEWLYFCKNQHPLMGSEDPTALINTGEYLLVRKGSKDNAEKLSAKDLEAVERYDRSAMPDAVVIRGRTGRPSMSRQAPPVSVNDPA